MCRPRGIEGGPMWAHEYMRAQGWMPFGNANATGSARRRGKRGRTDMHGLVGCIVEVGHWRDSEGVGEPPKWVAEYEARVGAVVVLSRWEDGWKDAPTLLVMILTTGKLHMVELEDVIVPESERDWRD